MKRIVLLLLASLPMLVQAQNVSWKFFDRYTKAEGFTSVQLERKDDADDEPAGCRKGRRRAGRPAGRYPVYPDRGARQGGRGQFVADAEALAAAPDNRFHLVMSETEGGQTTKFYLREAEFYYYSELLMLTYGTKETVAVEHLRAVSISSRSLRLSSIRPTAVTVPVSGPEQSVLHLRETPGLERPGCFRFRRFGT